MTYINVNLELQALGLPDNVAKALVRSSMPADQKKSNKNGNFAEDIIISVYQVNC